MPRYHEQINVTRNVLSALDAGDLLVHRTKQ